VYCYCSTSTNSYPTDSLSHNHKTIVATKTYNNDRKMGVDRDNIVVDTKPRSEKMDNSKVCLLYQNHAAETNIALEAQSIIVGCHPPAKR
jgi:hypothetical protein